MSWHLSCSATDCLLFFLQQAPKLSVTFQHPPPHTVLWQCIHCSVIPSNLPQTTSDRLESSGPQSCHLPWPVWQWGPVCNEPGQWSELAETFWLHTKGEPGSAWITITPIILYQHPSSKELTRNSVHLIQDHQPPFLAPHPFHYSLSLPRTLGGVTQHRIGADGYGAADGLVLGIRSEAADLRVINSGPHLELSLPLLHWHRGVAQHQTAFTNCARRRHSHQRFTRSYSVQPMICCMDW